MNKREARCYVYRVLATEVRHHISNGSEWTFIGDDEKEMSEADTNRIYAVLEDIADSFQRKAQRLATPSEEEK